MFQFASLQSRAGSALLNAHSDAALRPDSIALLEQGRFFTESSAALRIARRLAFPVNLAYVLIAVPRPIRDAVYRWVANHRYRWFGRRDVCMIPTPELRARFLPD